MKKVKVFDLVGKNAISMQSGTKLHDVIFEDLKSGNAVEIDFTDVSLYASPFFNASVGILLNDLTIEQLTQRMKVVNCSEVGLGLLNTVIQNALQYYSGSRAVTDTLDKHGEE